MRQDESPDATRQNFYTDATGIFLILLQLFVSFLSDSAVWFPFEYVNTGLIFALSKANHNIEMKLTIKITKGTNGILIGQIKEIPNVLTQGKSIEEVKENIVDALELYLTDMRQEKAHDNESIVAEQEFTY